MFCRFQVVIDIIRKSLLETPIYVNVSNWGPVILTSGGKKSVRNVKREKNSSPPSSPNEGKSGLVKSKID